jgi:hypothetical protein
LDNQILIRGKLIFITRMKFDKILRKN